MFYQGHSRGIFSFAICAVIVLCSHTQRVDAGFLQKVAAFFAKHRTNLFPPTSPTVEMEQYRDNPIARASLLSGALETLCGSYQYVQRGTIDEETEKAIVQQNLTEAANRLSVWHQQLWGQDNGDDSQEVSVEREETIVELRNALRLGRFNKFWRRWQRLDSHEQQSWGMALVEDEISRWKKLVRVGVFSQSGSDDSHCFLIAVALVALPPDHKFSLIAGTLRQLDGRSPLDIVACAKRLPKIASPSAVEKHTVVPLRERARGRIVAKVVFNEGTNETARGKFLREK